MITIRAKDIIEWGNSEGYKFEFIGMDDIEIIGYSSLKKYKEGALTWINLKNPVDEALLSRINCAVIQKGVKNHPDNCFITEESKKFFFGILEQFFTNKNEGIAEMKNTYIGKNVKLGKNVKIGCNCILDGEISIGDNTIIEHNVTMINRVDIGSDCIIHAGTVIGEDGFGYAFCEDNKLKKVHHFGGVQIGDRVEIGSNCVIDRGTIDDTIIGDDTKIYSMVIIAHNVTVGKSCLIIGHTNLAGSSEVGDYSYISMNVCIENHKKVGNNSFVGMGVMVHRNIGDNEMLLKSDSKPVQCKDYRKFL